MPLNNSAWPKQPKHACDASSNGDFPRHAKQADADFDTSAARARGLRWRIVIAVSVIVVVCVVVGICFALCWNARNDKQAQQSLAKEALTEAVESYRRQASQSAGLDADAASFSANAPEVLQYPDYYAGCEVCSLTSALKGMGFDVTPDELIEDYLDFSEDGDFSEGFVGNPYTSGVCFPPVIVKCADKYLEAHGSAYRFADYSGKTISELEATLNKGVPVIVWTLTDYEYAGMWLPGGTARGGAGEGGYSPDVLSSDEHGYSWYMNEHCVLLLSVDDDNVYLMDPQYGYVSCDREQFETVYDFCGKFACAVDLS